MNKKNKMQIPNSIMSANYQPPDRRSIQDIRDEANYLGMRKAPEQYDHIVKEIEYLFSIVDKNDCIKDGNQLIIYISEYLKKLK